MSTLLGAVDRVESNRISGWAWNPEDPEGVVLVEILDGDRVLATVRADKFRKDLQSLGGRGNHAFGLNLDPSLLPDSVHTIRVLRLPDRIDLEGSPKLLVREDTSFDSRLESLLGQAVNNEIGQAREPEDLNRVVGAMADQLARLTARQAFLAARASGLEASVETSGPAGWFGRALGELGQRYEPVLLPTADAAPTASIIIPVHGKFQLTYDCLKSLLEHLPEATFEVIVVDDASSDETLLAPLVFGGTVRVLRNEKNLGFVGSCNRGAAEARGQYLLFLNNDTLVQDGWLDALLQTYDAVPRLGIVGSRLIGGDGLLQESGGIIWRLGDGWNFGRGAHVDDPRFNYLRDADYVSGAALMIPRELFSQMGGFDAEFAPAYYEDTDLCFRVRAAGWRVMVQPASAVVHLEGQTAGTSVTGTGMKRFQAINHRKFLRRWKDTLASHRFNGEQPELECERTVSRRALFIDETTLTPDQDAGSNAALQHIRSLQRLGYKVSFVPADNLSRHPPYTRQLQSTGVECLYAPFVPSVEDLLRSRAGQFDLVYLHRFSNASRYAPLVRRHQPRARIVYNVADLHHLRMEREAALLTDPVQAAAAAAKAAEMRRGELAAVQAVDATLVHSAVEADLLAQALPEAPVHVVPWAYPLQPVATPAAQRRGLVFVGGYRHVPNVDAVLWLVREVMPLVWAELPDLPLTLLGSHMPDSVRQLASERIEAIGYVPDTAPTYERRLLSVAPLRYGAGVKGKVLEAFSRGVPCVMTSCAAEGVALDEALGGLVTDDPAAFAALIVDLHRDPERVEALARSCQVVVQAHYSAEVLDRALRAAVAPAVPGDTPPFA